MGEDINEYFSHLYRPAFEVCNATVLSQNPPDDGELYCKSTFDGWGCWNYTLAGQVAEIPCPLHIGIFQGKGPAHKLCTKNGTWFRHVSGKFWANYTSCLETEEPPHVDSKTYYLGAYLMFGGFTLSLILLTLAQLIFFSFKQLRCERITLHKNLFASYMLTGVLKIIYFATSVVNGDVLLENPVWCQVIHVLAEYAPNCNYFWMFCEGLYLYTVLVWTFRSGKRFLYLCCAIGWGVPLILTIIYAVVRSQYKDHTVKCWSEKSVFQWITFGPTTASILINIFFISSIVLVLLTKLRDMSNNLQTRVTFRATMILIPLLGLQHLVMGFEPQPDSQFYRTYHVISLMFLSIQGAFAAIMYCFWNGEVIAVIRRWYKQRQNVITKRTYITMNTDPAMAGNCSKTMDTDLTTTSPSKPVNEFAEQEETLMMITPE